MGVRHMLAKITLSHSRKFSKTLEQSTMVVFGGLLNFIFVRITINSSTAAGGDMINYRSILLCRLH